MKKPKIVRRVPLAKMKPLARRKRVDRLIASGKSAAVPTDFLPEDVRRRRYGLYANTPGKRKLVPDAYLTPEQLEKRRKATQARAPFVPGSTTTNAEVARDRNAATTLQFADEDHALGEAVRSSQHHKDTGIPAYFQAYQNALREAQEKQRGITAFAAGQAQTLQADDRAIQGQVNDQIGQALGANAAITGGTAPTNVQEVGNAGARVRQALTGSVASALLQRGAADETLLNQRGVNAVTQQREAQGREFNREMGLRGDQRVVAKKKGAFKTDYTERRRATEEKRALENYIFETELGQKKSELDAKAKADANKPNEYGYSNAAWAKMSAKRRQKVMARVKRMGRAPTKPPEFKDHFGYSPEQWRDMTPEQRRKAKALWEKAGDSGGGKKGGASRQEPASSLDTRRSILDRAEGFLPDYAESRGGLTPENRKNIVAKLRRSHPGYFKSPAEELKLSAALDLAIDGRIKSGTLKRLRERGIYVTSAGGYWASANTGAS
jgi:hypothetical protein